MIRFLILLAFSGTAHALSAEAQEFMRITDELEAVQCEKRKLRYAIALAGIERRGDDERALRERFAALNRDPKTARLERRLARLEPILRHSPDPEDLRAIDRQRAEAFYRCG